MDTLSMPRLGVVVPPENPTAEPEFNRLVGGVMNAYASRFPMIRGKGLRGMLERYNEVLPEVLDGFGGMRLDAALVACSASHYLLSPGGDEDFCADLTERCGYPVCSSTQAILALFRELHLSRLVIVSPYEPWLTDVSRNFWEEAGLTVQGVVSVPAEEGFDPYRVTTETILERVRLDAPADDTPLLFTGTGMATLAALTELGRDTDRVMVTSNLASAWWALGRVGGAEAGAHAHPALARVVGAVAARSN